jgi:hypothetical protein
MVMRKVYEVMHSVFNGMLVGLVFILLWSVLRFYPPQVMVVLAALALVAIIAFLLWQACQEKLYLRDVRDLLLYSAIFLLVAYVTGRIVGLGYFTKLGLPAGLDTVSGAWLLHIFFGGLYWFVLLIVIEEARYIVADPEVNGWWRLFKDLILLLGICATIFVAAQLSI